MSDELDDLYQELILDHGRRPRNFGQLEHSNHHAEGFNPLCGDHIELDLLVEDGVIVDLKFHGRGCAISTASASLMTQALKGLRVEDVDGLFHKFHDLVTTEGGDEETLGKLAAFAGVRRFPTRVKCASLAWHTMMSALEGTGTATTE